MRTLKNCSLSFVLLLEVVVPDTVTFSRKYFNSLIRELEYIHYDVSNITKDLEDDTCPVELSLDIALFHIEELLERLRNVQ